MAKVLIIDDEAPILNLMSKSCRQQGHEVSSVQTGKEGIATLDAEDSDLMIVDLLIGDMNGLDLIRYSRDKHPNTKVIMVTGNGSIETAIEAMRLGAFDYLQKPFELADLQKAVDLALEPGVSRPTAEVETDYQGSDITVTPRTLIGESEKMKDVFSVIEKIADNPSPVLLEGEFGSGKQMVARSIHNASHRVDSPFKVLQCSSLPEDLLEFELFGSGGGRDTIFARAAGGTVLLEEIHLLPIRLQSKLDGYLESVTARRNSGDLPETMDVRFIASSAKPLDELVNESKFREDLFYKVSIIPIPVAPLRNRKDDIIPLAEYFLQQYADRTKTKLLTIDKYATRLLEGYSWPGNVGELQNAIERACAFAEKGVVRPVDLPPKVAQKVEITDEDERTTHHLPIGTRLSDFVKKQEKIFIRETLKYNGGSREKTASMLDVSIATLYRKMGVKLEREKVLKKAD